MGYKIQLTNAEMFTAAFIGIRRRIYAIVSGKKAARGLSEDADVWGMDIEGAGAELAVAKLLNRYWNGTVGETKPGDVGGIEVRSSTKHNNRMIVYENAPDDTPFIFVTGKIPNLEIRGWMTGKDAKKHEYWTNPSGGDRYAYFVPVADLKPMHHLFPESIKEL